MSRHPLDAFDSKQEGRPRRAQQGGRAANSAVAADNFVCRQGRLVVEVDGEVHARRAHLDALRDQQLQRAGYRVLRIPAALVTSNLAAAVALVRAALE